MGKTFTSYDRYRSDFGTFLESRGGEAPPWLGDVRAGGFSSFDRLGFPTAGRGNERWKHTSVVPIARSTFGYAFEAPGDGITRQALRRAVPWDDGWTRLVFLDGRYHGALSSDGSQGNGIRAISLEEAVRDDGRLVEKHLARYVNVDDDGFAAINTAFIRDGAFVFVPDEAAPVSPVHLVFVSTGQPTPRVSYPRALVLAGRHSRLTVVESYVGMSRGTYFTNAVTEIVAEAGAEIEHYRHLAESPASFHIGATKVSLDRDSSIRSTSLARGARLARNGLDVLLNAPGSSCVVNGLYVTAGAQHIDNHVDIDHARPHTTSDQYFKGVLSGRSRAVFSGRVLIRQDAQKSQARQADKNLMLSEGARTNTKPSMEIYADDVKAVHGATVGAVAEDALFYMRSRGLDLEMARRLLVLGFAGEIIDTIQLDRLRDHVNRLLLRTLPSAGATAVGDGG